MKNTHKCPKCQSTDIIRITGEVGSYGTGNNIRIGQLSWRVKVTRYLCASCGFSEEWIDSPDDIARLKKKFGQVPG